MRRNSNVIINQFNSSMKTLGKYQNEAKQKYNCGALLTKGETNTKLNKTPEITYNMSLLPANMHPKFAKKSTCSDYTEGCKAICIVFSGRAALFSMINEARANKTEYFFSDNKTFTEHLYTNIKNVAERHKAKNENVVIRLNTFSDIDFVHLLQARTNFKLSEFKNVKFYDYTASIKKALKYKDSKYITHTFSRKENNWDKCIIALENGLNVSAVFENKLPTTYKGFKVIDGDITDTEMLRHSGVILGLKSKGNKAKNDQTGFVIR